MGKYDDLFESEPVKGGKYSDLFEAEKPKEKPVGMGERMFPRVTARIRSKGQDTKAPALRMADAGIMDVLSGVAGAVSRLPVIGPLLSGVGQVSEAVQRGIAPEGREYPLQATVEGAKNVVSKLPIIGELEAPQAALEIAGRTATDPLAYLGLAGKSERLARVGEMAAQAPGKSARSVGEMTTGISKETLSEASTKAGRRALEGAAANAPSSGIRLSDALTKFERNIPEAKRVEQILPNLGKIDLNPAIQALENAKAKIPSKSGFVDKAGEKAIAEIDDLISRMKLNKQGRAKPGQAFKTKYDPEEFKDIRERLDKGIDFDEIWAGDVNKAVLQARTEMKNALEQAAIKSGNPEYVDAMKAWSNKLQIRQELKDMIGEFEGSKQDVRATTFMKQAAKEGPGGPRYELLKKFDQEAGTHFVEEAMRTARALELGPEGKAQLIPKGQDKRVLSALFGAGGYTAGGPVGAGLTSLFTSPAALTRATIPVADATGQGVRSVGRGAKKIRPQDAAKASALLQFLGMEQN